VKLKSKVIGFSIFGAAALTTSLLFVTGLLPVGMTAAPTSSTSPSSSPSNSGSNDWNQGGEAGENDADKSKETDDWETIQAERLKVYTKQPLIAQAVHQDVSKPFRAIRASKITAAPEEEGNGGERAAEEARAALLPRLKGKKPSVDFARQKQASAGSGNVPSVSTPTPATGWVAQSSGTANAGRYAPPDTNMDVSETQIVQTVNTGLAIWNKNGTVAKAAVPISTLWSGFGGYCQTTNDGRLRSFSKAMGYQPVRRCFYCHRKQRRPVFAVCCRKHHL
jgi:hypothetical protein